MHHILFGLFHSTVAMNWATTSIISTHVDGYLPLLSPWGWLSQILQGSALLQPALTLTEILPCSLGKWAARNQSPGRGLVMLKTPVVRLGSVQVSVRTKEPGTAVSLGKCMPSGLMTGGAPERKYLLRETKVRVGGRRAGALSWGRGGLVGTGCKRGR